MRRLILAFAAILAAVASAQPSRGNPDMQLGGESVDAMIASFMKEHDVPGVSLAIVQAPYITRVTGYGVGDADRRTLVSANTLFDIGSMKDAFTAVAAMQLVEKGKLALDEVAPVLRDRTRYAELEAMIERASGETYEEVVRKGQFERLGLEHTFFGSGLQALSRETFGPGERHRRFLQTADLIDPIEPATGYRDAAVRPAGRAIYASAYDISVWDIGLAGTILVHDPALRKIIYSAGSGPWFFPGHEGLMISTGSSAGFSSLLSRFTKSDELVCVTLLANREGLDLTQLARRIAGAHNATIGPPSRALRMRVQESPYSPGETRARARERGLPEDVEVWEEGGDVWIGTKDPGDAASRKAIDRLLLDVVM